MPLFDSLTGLLLVFGLGLLLAVGGGELFVSGVLAAGRALRLPAPFIAVTLAAFATSGPELAVSVTAALEGQPQLGLGDALGSNVVNLGLVLGLTLAASRLHVSRPGSLRRLGFMVAAPLLVAALAWDGALTRGEALVLLVAFLGWLLVEARTALGQRDTAPRERGDMRQLALGAGGLALLFAGGKLIVGAAQGMAALWGLDAYLFGATVVALGTSVPELATALASRRRGHHDVALSTLLGSNLFNGLLIVGVTALIHPILFDAREVAVALAAAALLALALVPDRAGVLGRGRGALLLGGYAAFLLALGAAA